TPGLCPPRPTPRDPGVRFHGELHEQAVQHDHLRHALRLARPGARGTAEIAAQDGSRRPRRGLPGGRLQHPCRLELAVREARRKIALAMQILIDVLAIIGVLALLAVVLWFVGFVYLIVAQMIWQLPPVDDSNHPVRLSADELPPKNKLTPKT